MATVVTIPTKEPTSFRVGDTVKWTKELIDFPAPTWTLTYFFRGVNGVFDIIATASGTVHAVTVSDTITVGFNAGCYFWSAVANDGSETCTVDNGESEVLVDLSVENAGFDGRTDIQKTFESIESVLLGRASNDVSSYTVAGRQLARTSIEDLIKLYDKFKQLRRQEIDKQRLESGQATNRKVVTRFTSV